MSPTESMSFFYPIGPFLFCLHSQLFWCVVFIHIHSQFCGKLDPRDVKCIFIGYASNKKGYHCYHLQVESLLPLWMLLLMKLNLFTLDISLEGEFFWSWVFWIFESSFIPFIEEPSHSNALGTPNTFPKTCGMDISKVVDGDAPSRISPDIHSNRCSTNQSTQNTIVT